MESSLQAQIKKPLFGSGLRDVKDHKALKSSLDMLSQQAMKDQNQQQ